METCVVLDANTYCESNYGRSAKFGSLLDFLKKTNSRLLLLPSILEEVLAKHERDFRAQVENLKRAHKEVAKYCFTDKKPTLLNGEPNFAGERDALRLSMLNVGKSVRVDYSEVCTGVDILEVARRGARRIPPASANGEELRDVIHWLAILAYTKHNDVKIFFVTRDNGFWGSGPDPKDEILQEVKDTAQRIQFYKDIDDLLKQNSLSSVPLDSNRVLCLLDIAQLATGIVERVGKYLDRVETGDSTVEFKSGTMVSAKFESGTAYKVSDDSEFLEATFQVNITAQIEFKRKIDAWASVAWPSLAGERTVPLSSLSGIQRPPVSIDVIAYADICTRIIDGKTGPSEIERVVLRDLR